MAIRPIDQYPGQAGAVSAGYPDGSAQNVTVSGDGTGTPLEKSWVNDVFGFIQSMLGIGDITPSGTPDAVGDGENESQIVEGLDARFGSQGRLRHFTALSTGFDLDLSVDLSLENIRGMYVQPRGKYFYVCEGDDVYQFQFGERFDIVGSTQVGSYESVETPTVQNLFIKPDDGLKMWLVGSDDVIYEYDLSTAWDVTTASYSSNSLNVNAQADSPDGIWWSDDGTKIFVTDRGTTDGVYRYTATTPWDISTASFDVGQFLDVSATFFSPLMVNVTSDGKRVYVSTGSSLRRWDLSTAFDLTTASINGDTYNGYSGKTGIGLSRSRGYVYVVDTSGFQPIEQHVIGRTVCG